MQEHEQSGGPPLDQSGAGAPARETAAASRTRVRPSPTPGEQNPHPHPNRLRQRVFEIVEVGREEDRASQIFDTSLTILILLNVVAFAIETVPSIEAAYGPQLLAFEVFSVAVFTIEYVLRIWSAVEVPFLSRLSPLRARLKFASRPYLIVDLLAIAPFYVGTLLGLDLRALRLLRLFRFLKLARYSPALHTIVRVLINERRSLMGAGLLMLTAVLFASTGIYYIEREAQPETFGTIPDAAWWAMSTLTTVGYGDVHPITPIGKAFGALVMVMGLGLFALPIAIIATGFSQEVGRHDFVVTWSLMSRIPLFSGLDAHEVAEIMGYLAAHNFPPNWEVIREGAPGEGMYFVASGRVRVTTQAGETILGAGDFFGEIAMLDGMSNAFAYTTVSNCRLLKLNREDFQRLTSLDPGISAQIYVVAEARKKAREEGRPDPHGNKRPGDGLDIPITPD